MCLNDMGEGKGSLFTAPLGRRCGVREGAHALQLDRLGPQYLFCHLLVVWL